jgi:hypothetical protein
MIKGCNHAGEQTLLVKQRRKAARFFSIKENEWRIV